MTLMDQIFNLRMTVKQMERLHKKCEKEEAKMKTQVMKVHASTPSISHGLVLCIHSCEPDISGCLTTYVTNVIRINHGYQ